MLEIECTKCNNLLNEVDGCKLYGADPAEAVKACALDGFKNATVIKILEEQDHDDT